MFFQVFDKGTMDDAEGREIDFRNTLIILTSNVGSQAVRIKHHKAPDQALKRGSTGSAELASRLGSMEGGGS